MSTCTKCGVSLEDGELLPGGKVYSKMAGGEGREKLLSSYSGVKYGSATVFCADCLDTPSECSNCNGTGVVDSGGSSNGETDEDPAHCPECDGTGATKPDILRDSCRF